MNLPTLADLATTAQESWPYLLAGTAVVTATLACVAYLARRTTKTKPASRKAKPSLENRLTFIVAVIAAGIAAQGMWRFFRDTLDFPVELRIVAFAVLELVTFTCAMRARRNILDPSGGKAGVDGIAVWVVTALSGAFSATDADEWPEAVFRLAMPLLAAWLWERGMSIERRRVRGGSTIHWRVTPERVLVWMRVAEPSGRTASEVDAHRRLTRVAKAAARVRMLKSGKAWDWRVSLAQGRLERAMRSAVAHAGLAGDADRQKALIAQLGSMYNAGALADLTPDAPWADLTSQPTVFDSLGVPYSPAPHILPPVGLALGSPTGPVTGPVDRSETGSTAVGSGRSETPQTYRSGTQVRDGEETRSANRSADRSASQVPDPTDPTDPTRSAPQVSDPVPDPSPRARKTQTGPKKRTRSKNKPKPKPLDRIAEAEAVDKAYLDEHGRHIPAEKLARALSIGKPAALDLVKQIRGGHLDLAKAVDE